MDWIPCERRGDSYRLPLMASLLLHPPPPPPPHPVRKGIIVRRRPATIAVRRSGMQANLCDSGPREELFLGQSGHALLHKNKRVSVALI